MPEIIQLSTSVINKIAAGEVVERPASVVKELLENAIDAGATRIDVAVEQGGTELIRLVDNGCGISRAQLPMAVASHATSKIQTADDLFSVGTFGFRGEALASIAEISHFLLRSRPPEEEAGYELAVNGGQTADIVPCGCPSGTTIEIRRLFFNTPVRQKFLRTTQTEMAHITEVFTRSALAHPQIHFTLSHNGRSQYDLTATDQWLQRITAFFGRELADALLLVESEDGPIQIRGYVANPTQSRSNNKMQYVFLNGRPIRDRALQHALGEAYRGLLLTGRFPVAFLHMTMPLDMVDVNVHPTKLEVRFQDSGQLYSQLLGMLRSRFLTTDLTAKVDLPSDGTTSKTEPAKKTEPATRQDFAQWARSPHVAATQPSSPAVEQSALASFPRQSLLDLQKHSTLPDAFSVGQSPTASVTEATEESSLDDLSVATVSTHPSTPTTNPQSAPSTRAVQIHNRYIVTEGDDGVVVIDQHALHERILYELLREKVLAQNVETQKLLVPEPVALGPVERATLLEHRDLLKSLGISVEDFGGDTVLLSSYPAMLANLEPEDLLRHLSDKLLEGRQIPDQRDVLDELLHLISCKAAVKAGDRLSNEEITTLIDQRHVVQDSHHCPHGRPTTLVFTRQELDRRFKRI